MGDNYERHLNEAIVAENTAIKNAIKDLLKHWDFVERVVNIENTFLDGGWQAGYNYLCDLMARLKELTDE